MSLQEVAAEVGCLALGIPEDAEPPVIRRSVLERLRDRDYVLPPAEREAICLLLGARLSGSGGAGRDPTARGIWGLRLRQEIDAYCARFWTLSPPDRLRQWEELASFSSDSPPARSRLLALRHAVDFDMPDLAGQPPAVKALGRLLCELCVRPPSQRAALLRRRFGARRPSQAATALQNAAVPPDFEHVSSRAAWRDAAAFLGRTHPRLAQLDGGCCIRELTSRPPLKRSTRARIPPVAAQPLTIRLPRWLSAPNCIARRWRSFQRKCPRVARDVAIAGYQFGMACLILGLSLFTVCFIWLLLDLQEYASRPARARVRAAPPLPQPARKPSGDDRPTLAPPPMSERPGPPQRDDVEF